MSIHGDKQYEQRARAILPMLVRQAQAGQAITYMGLSLETAIHHRAFAYPLGTVAEVLRDLGEQGNEPIPALTSIVVNSYTGRPGPGFGWAVAGMDGYQNMPPWRQTVMADQAREECFHYDKWPAVLAALGLPPVEPAVSPALLAAAAGRGSGEGERHRRLKEFVAANPALVGLPRSTPRGTLEYLLPSADAIDVLFVSGDEYVAVEVKAANAGPADILRGLYQCVKYTALLKAELAVKGERPAARAVLALEASLPEALIPARNTLGITVYDSIVPIES